MSQSQQQPQSTLLLSTERLVALVTIVAMTCAGAYKLSKFFTLSSPFVEALSTISVVSVLAALGGSSLIHFATSMPATAIRFVNLQDPSWDDSLVVRWAAMLQTTHDMQASNSDAGSNGVTVTEIQASMLLMIVGFIGMRLVHHAVVIARLLKVARRNQHLMIKNKDGK